MTDKWHVQNMNFNQIRNLVLESVYDNEDDPPAGWEASNTFGLPAQLQELFDDGNPVAIIEPGLLWFSRSLKTLRWTPFQITDPSSDDGSGVIVLTGCRVHREAFTASTTWTMQHWFGSYPWGIAQDTSGVPLGTQPTISHGSLNSTTFTHSGSVAGFGLLFG